MSPTKESSPDTSGSRFVPNFILFKVKDQRYANYLDKVYLTLTVRPRNFRDEGGRLRNGNLSKIYSACMVTNYILLERFLFFPIKKLVTLNI